MKCPLRLFSRVKSTNSWLDSQPFASSILASIIPSLLSMQRRNTAIIAWWPWRRCTRRLPRWECATSQPRPAERCACKIWRSCASRFSKPGGLRCKDYSFQFLRVLQQGDLDAAHRVQIATVLVVAGILWDSACNDSLSTLMKRPQNRQRWRRRR